MIFFKQFKTEFQKSAKAFFLPKNICFLCLKSSKENHNDYCIIVFNIQSSLISKLTEGCQRRKQVPTFCEMKSILFVNFPTVTRRTMLCWCLTTLRDFNSNSSNNLSNRKNFLLQKLLIPITTTVGLTAIEMTSLKTAMMWS